MARPWRLFVVVGIAAITLIIVVFVFTPLVNSVSSNAAKATIIAAVLTLLGTVFTALFGEINSYYTELAAANKAKRKLIFPLLQNHYVPWINAAYSLKQAFDQAIIELGGGANSIDPETVKRILYVTGLFYTVRLRFIIEGGGLVILSSKKEEETVNNLYRDFESAYDWAGVETSRRVSLLQDTFFKNDKPADPYVLQDFFDDITKPSPLSSELAADLEKMKVWANKENLDKAKNSLEKFSSTLHDSVSNLSAAWW